MLHDGYFMTGTSDLLSQDGDFTIGMTRNVLVPHETRLGNHDWYSTWRLEWYGTIRASWMVCYDREDYYQSSKDYRERKLTYVTGWMMSTALGGDQEVQRNTWMDQGQDWRMRCAEREGGGHVPERRTEGKSDRGTRPWRCEKIEGLSQQGFETTNPCWIFLLVFSLSAPLIFWERKTEMSTYWRCEL